MTRPPFSPPVMDWMNGHAIDPAVAIRAGVREDRGALLFPIVTRTGNRFTRTRLLPGPCLQPKGVSLAPWWIAGHRPARYVLVVEGEGDGLAAITARRECPRASTIHRLDVVVLPGAGVAHDVLLEDLAAHGTRGAVIAFDGDQAGRAATVKLGDRLVKAGINTLTIALPDGLDLADELAGSDDRAATFTDLISGADYHVPTVKPPRAPKTGRTPYRPAGGAQRDAFAQLLEELRTIEAEEYLETLAPESEPARGRCRCPLPNHEDRNPSASYSGTVFYCHRCGVGGGLLDLAAAIAGLATTGPDFPELVRWTAERFNLETAAIVRPYHERRAA